MRSHLKLMHMSAKTGMRQNKDLSSFMRDDALDCICPDGTREKMDGEEQETLYRSELADYEEQIQKAILKERHVEEEPRGLMHYFDGNRQVAAKVISAFPKVQNIRGELFGVLECSICQPLTQNEIYELKNFWDGQMSDGWGEGFEQRPIYTQEGELYVSFWTQERHWGVMTEEELDRIWNHGMTQTL